MKESDESVIESTDGEVFEVNALVEDDLAEVAGGGTFGDIYDALNESWTDIKKGFMDAWND